MDVHFAFSFASIIGVSIIFEPRHERRATARCISSFPVKRACVIFFPPPFFIFLFRRSLIVARLPAGEIARANGDVKYLNVRYRAGRDFYLIFAASSGLENVIGGNIFVLTALFRDVVMVINRMIVGMPE